jgi:hypothetical protein
MDGYGDLPHPASRRLEIGRWPEVALGCALFFIPLAIGLVWGTHFDDSAYVTLRYARDLVVDQGLACTSAAEPALSPSLTLGIDCGAGLHALLRSPVYTLALWLPAKIGVPLPQASLVLSALGWGATAVAVYSVGRAMGQPVVAVVSAALMAFNPIVSSTLGTEIPWVIALAWIAIAATTKKRWHTQISASALTLGMHFGLGTLALATLLLVVQWIERKRFPILPSLVLASITLALGLMGSWQTVAPLSELSLNLAEWRQGIQWLIDESEFYWLFIPFMGLGLLALTGKIWAVGFLGCAAFIISGGAVSGAMGTALGLFLVGLGIDWSIRWIETHNLVRLDHVTLVMSTVFVAGLPLGLAQTSSLLRRYQLRPVARQALEQQTGDWLRAHSEPTATIFGSHRIGYLADRVTIPWDGSDGNPTQSLLLVRALAENPPEYAVSLKSIAWDRLTRTSWFQDHYERLQEFASPFDASSPFVIWGYRSSPFDLGEHRPLNVRTPGEVDFLGYKYWPDRIEPGETVYVTLFLRATQSVSDSVRAVLRVTSPNDGVSWAQRSAITHRSVLEDGWQTEQIVVDQFVLTTTTDIPVGTYHLNVSAMTPDLGNIVPMYRNGDTSPLDQIILGPVVVPWRGELDTATMVDATFGDQIALLGFEAVDNLSPGAEFDVTLYWTAQRTPEDDYIVFVHLLGAEGQAVAGHDGPPMAGRYPYPTSAWLTGDVVPDVHRLVLDPETPMGTYQIRVGMYSWPSLERLPVLDSQGAVQAEGVIVLQSIEVR